MVSPAKDVAWLDWITRLMGEPAPEQGPVVRIPPERYYCLLDEQPTHLVPQRLLHALENESGSDHLIVNPDCGFAEDSELPFDLGRAALSVEKFAKGRIAWLGDAATGIILPFWLGEEFGSLLSELVPGREVSANLPEDARRILAMAGILVREGHAERRREVWAEVVHCCAPIFRSKGYVPLGRLLHPFHLAALRRYYRYLIRKGKLQLGDDNNPHRYVVHNEPVARYFHHQLRAAMSHIAGQRVKPSYVYVGSYLPGAKLRKHTDRPQCEFSMNLLLDYSPEPVCETPWPLHLESKGRLTTLYQAIGDVLLYRGCQVAHYRNPLPEGHTSTSIFFHYVPEGYSGSLD
jgi:hypothetical protein